MRLSKGSDFRVVVFTGLALVIFSFPSILRAQTTSCPAGYQASQYSTDSSGNRHIVSCVDQKTGSYWFAGKIADSGGQVYNVKAYGAKGDGTVDDTVAIRSAVAAASSVGGTVLFPPGTYLMSGGVTVSGKVVTIEGSGIGATTIKATGGLSGALFSEGLGGVIRIESMIVNMSDAPNDAVWQQAVNGPGTQAFALIRNVRMIYPGGSSKGKAIDYEEGGPALYAQNVEIAGAGTCYYEQGDHGSNAFLTNIDCGSPVDGGFDYERTNSNTTGQVVINLFDITGRPGPSAFGFKANSTVATGQTPVDIFCNACQSDNIRGGDSYFFKSVGNIFFSNGWGYNSAPSTLHFAALRLSNVTQFSWVGGMLQSNYEDLVLENGLWHTSFSGVIFAGTNSNILATGVQYDPRHLTITAATFSARAPFSAPTAKLLGGAISPPASTTVTNLPRASSLNAGSRYTVTDSTAISTEGQRCTGGGSTVAMAFSDGSKWKCF